MTHRSRARALDTSLLSRAERVQGLSDELAALRSRGHVGPGDRKSEEYLAKLEEWWAAFHAFHDPLEELPSRIRAGEPRAIAEGVVYLETAPRCFRSGYVAEGLLGALSRADLSALQQARCRAVVVGSLTNRQARGWRRVAALAGSVWAPSLDEALSVAARADARVARRVDLLLADIDGWRRSVGR
jgi:hypothetical protein